MASPASSPLDLLNHCVAHVQHGQHSVDANTEVTLSDSCPNLSLALSDPAFAQLEPALEDDTTLGQLRDAQRSLLSLQAPPATAKTLDYAGLQSLLKQVYDPAKEPKPVENPIDKMLDWISQKIHDFFKRDNWLTRHLPFENKLNKNVIKGFTKLLVVIIIVLVLFIVINELRAADILSLLRRKHRRGRRQGEQVIEAHRALPPGLKQIGELPLQQQVPALLRYSLQCLIDKHILPRRYNLTNQEFLGILKQELPTAGRDFEFVVTSGEQVVYGNKPLPPGDAAQLFEHVRNLEKIPIKASS
jgi:hypothetical protein